MASGVYEIRNTVNGMVYVGSSVDVYARKKSHFYHLRKGNHQNEHLQRAFDKYGGECFEFSVAREVPIDQLVSAEQEQMDRYESSSLYNILKFAYSTRGYEMSDESKAKLSASKMGHDVSAETRKKMSDAKIGTKRSEEVKRSMSEKLRGREFSQETRNKISEANRGRVVSEETKKRQSESAKLRKASDETRRKISIASSRRWESDDYRARCTPKRKENKNQNIEIGESNGSL